MGKTDNRGISRRTSFGVGGMSTTPPQSMMPCGLEGLTGAADTRGTRRHGAAVYERLGEGFV